MRNDRLEDLLLPGRKVGPAEAVEAGFADELVPEDQVLARAHEVARELAALPQRAYAGTKRRMRNDTAEHVLSHLEDDIGHLTAHMA